MKRFFDRELHPKRNYILVYTLLYFLMAFACFCYFWVNGRSFISYIDGITQHYKSLVFYSRWLREILKNIVQNHSLDIPAFSFSIGLGEDIVTTLHYYCIGDPFNLLSVFVPVRYLVHYFDIMVVARLYVAGLMFSLYAGYMGKKRAAVLAGAFVYVFSGFSLYFVPFHPYFADPVAFFPLVLYGVEKIRKENSPWAMITGVALSALSNFYFMYMIVILVIGYVAVETFVPFDKNVKERIVTALKIAGYSLVGMMLSAALFLPVLLLFFGDERSQTMRSIPLFYNVEYYAGLLPGLITSVANGDYDSVIGICPVVLPALFLIFRKKGKNLRLKISLAAMFAALLFPVCALVMNGFSYAANRWTWGLAMALAYAFTVMWDELKELSKKDCLYLGGCFAIYLAVCHIVAYPLSREFYCSFVIAALAFVIPVLAGFIKKKNPEHGKLKDGVLVACSLAAVAVFAYFSEASRISGFRPINEVNAETYATEKPALEKVDSFDEFFRYSGNSGEALSVNGTVINGGHATRRYWSLSNGSLVDFLNKNLVRIKFFHNMPGLDTRTALEEIVSTRYFVTTDPDNYMVPYGYELTWKEGMLVPAADGGQKRLYVYKNANELPFGFTYFSAISEEEAGMLSAADRQDAVLQAAILSDTEGTKHADIKPVSVSIPYEIRCNSDKVSRQGNSFVVAPFDEDEDVTVTFSFKGLPESETYFYIKGLTHTWPDGWKEEVSKDVFSIIIYSETEDGTEFSSHIFYESPRYKWYNYRTEDLANMYYCDSPARAMSVLLPEPGTYSFDDIQILCQPMAGYEEKTAALRETVLEDVDFHENEAFATNLVTGNITLDEPKILFLSIPYSKGWTAYVDGVKTKLVKADYGFMALKLDPGTHDIRLRYRTPGMRAGVYIFVLGCLVIAAVVIVRKKKGGQNHL